MATFVGGENLSGVVSVSGSSNTTGSGVVVYTVPAGKYAVFRMTKYVSGGSGSDLWIRPSGETADPAVSMGIYSEGTSTVANVVQKDQNSGVHLYAGDELRLSVSSGTASVRGFILEFNIPA